MPLDPATSAAMRADTLDAAAVFLEDFDHIRSLIASKVPNREDARRLSVILRRWLLEGDLLGVANPRIGRARILAPDFTSTYLEIAIKKPMSFFAADFLGPRAAALYSFQGNGQYSMGPANACPISVEQFREQKAVYFQHTWLTRRDLIRYVANEKSGVHSGQEEKIANKFLISRLEMAMTLVTTATTHHLTISDPPMIPPKSTYRKGTLNPVLVAMYITAATTVFSPDIEQLAELIRQEVT